MNRYKYIIFGAVFTAWLTGCGGTAGNESALSLQSGAGDEVLTTLSSRMIDVGKGYSNQEAVDHDYATLELPKYIISSLQLPTEGAAGSDINWSLLTSGNNFSLSVSDDNTTLVVYDGRTQPEYAKLSAFINYDLNVSQEEANRTKEFCVTILPEAHTPEEKVAQDIKIVCGNKFPITIDLNSTEPYKSCSLPIEGANESNITWISCRPDLLEVNETNHSLRVPNPDLITGKTCVNLKGTFQYGDVNKTELFKVIILPQIRELTHEEACDVLKKAAEDLRSRLHDVIDINDGLYPSLPLSMGDVEIRWVSCDTSAVEIETGNEEAMIINKNQSGEDKMVKIKAVLKLQNLYKEVCFTVHAPSA